MSSEYLLLALLWVAYCVVHSALISISVTNWFKTVLGSNYRFYRLAYNTFSVIALLPLVAFSHSARFGSDFLFSWSGRWRILQFCLLGLAIMLFAAGARHYSLLQFLGIRQLREESAHGAMTASGAFDTTGVLGLTRHPWYVAVFILLWVGDLNKAAITVNIILSAYLAVGTLLEERKLVIEFGEEYRRYQDQVSMFVPLKWLTAKRPR